MPTHLAPAPQPAPGPRAEILLVGRADLGLGLDQLVNLVAHASIGLAFAEPAVTTTLVNAELVSQRAATDLPFDPFTEKLYQWVYRRGTSHLRMVRGQMEFVTLQLLACEAGLAHGTLRAELDPEKPHALLAVGPITDPATAARLWAHVERLALPEGRATR